ncbi:MAG: peptide-methionine (R)-S-oxide reductase MsrB [Cyclonatronaceae bacterium]
MTDSNLPEWFDPSLFPDPKDTLHLTEEEWEDRLSNSEFNVQRSEGTERPFDNEYYATTDEGVYICRGCSNPLFSSHTKFSSSSGWPSFYAPISPDHIGTKRDSKLFMERTEVHCARCGGHLGHVFDDGPQPTGLRYCMNSSSLRLIDEEAHRKISEGREDELDFRLNR